MLLWIFYFTNISWYYFIWFQNAETVKWLFKREPWATGKLKLIYIGRHSTKIFQPRMISFGKRASMLVSVTKIAAARRKSHSQTGSLQSDPRSKNPTSKLLCASSRWISHKAERVAQISFRSCRRMPLLIWLTCTRAATRQEKKTQQGEEAAASSKTLARPVCVRSEKWERSYDILAFSVSRLCMCGGATASTQHLLWKEKGQTAKESGSNRKINQKKYEPL